MEIMNIRRGKRFSLALAAGTIILVLVSVAFIMTSHYVRAYGAAAGSASIEKTKESIK